MKRAFLVLMAIFAGLLAGNLILGCSNPLWNHNYDGSGNFVLGTGVLTGNITINTTSPAIRFQASGTPAVGAEVWIEEFPNFRTTTDATGSYSIGNLPSGSFHVVASLFKVVIPIR